MILNEMNTPAERSGRLTSSKRFRWMPAAGVVQGGCDHDSLKPECPSQDEGGAEKALVSNVRSGEVQLCHRRLPLQKA